MARVTVEDCIEYVPNRFELVVMAAKRARQLSRGAEPTLPQERDKMTVLALREIGEATIDTAELLKEEEETPAVNDEAQAAAEAAAAEASKEGETAKEEEVSDEVKADAAAKEAEAEAKVEAKAEAEAAEPSPEEDVDPAPEEKPE